MAKFFERSITDIEIFGIKIGRKVKERMETSTGDDKPEDWDTIYINERKYRKK